MHITNPDVWLKITAAMCAVLVVGFARASAPQTPPASLQTLVIEPQKSTALALLKMKSVQQELSLSTSQVSQIGIIADGASGVLKPDQKQRLNELSLQYDGVEAWLKPALAKKLNLSEEQRTGLKNIVFEYLSPSANEKAKTSLIVRKGEALRLGLALLDFSQRAAWDQMAGRIFLKWEDVVV